MVNVQNNNIAFGSRFAPTEPLRKMFYDINSSMSGDIMPGKTITNALEALLNDGKDDIIEITGNRFGNKVTAKVNNEEIVSSCIEDLSFKALGNAVRNVIVSLAEKRNENLNIYKALNFEDKIVKTHKRKVIDYVNKPETSLDDIISFATKQKFNIISNIQKANRKKLDKIAENIFGEDRYYKAFKEYD